MGRGGQYAAIVCDDAACGARYRIASSRVAEAAAGDGLWCPVCRGPAAPAPPVVEGTAPLTAEQRQSIARIVAGVVEDADAAGRAALKHHVESRAALKRHVESREALKRRAEVPVGARRHA